MLSANTNLTESIIRVWSGDWNINIFTSKENNLNIVVFKKKWPKTKGRQKIFWELGNQLYRKSVQGLNKCKWIVPKDIVDVNVTPGKKKVDKLVMCYIICEINWAITTFVFAKTCLPFSLFTISI